MKKLIILIATLAFVGVGASGGSADNPKPLPPTAAQQAVDATATHSGDVQGTVVQPAQVPGLGGLGEAALAKSGAKAADPCWSITGLWTEWGIWPYQQRVTEDRYWCANSVGGAQYYRTSTVHLGTTLCSHSGEWQELISGGNGNTWSVIRTGGSFACPTDIPWITIHTDRWQDWSCNTWGNCSWVRSS
ncbi:MAG: hypothetical protein ACJ757_04720 [Gaiellaceae bacterium]